MQVEIKIDDSCIEPRVIIITDKVNDEISEDEYDDWKYNYPPTHKNNPSRMN